MMTTKQVVVFTGMRYEVFYRWIQDCPLTPTVRRRKGIPQSQVNMDKWDLMSMVGIAVAAEVKQSPRGCDLDYVARIVTGFARMSPKQLEALFREGWTHFVSPDPCDGTLVTLHRPRGGNTEWPDVKKLFDRATLAMSQCEAMVASPA